ncbi:MAG: glycosyltransferase, partial [Myxococcota bacterium]
ATSRASDRTKVLIEATISVASRFVEETTDTIVDVVRCDRSLDSELRTERPEKTVKRTPVAHVIFPRRSRTRPVLEFTWQAARALMNTPDLDVSVLIPVPVRPARRLMSFARRSSGQAPWPEDLEERLMALDPAPILVPYVPMPRRSTEAAAVALAAHFVQRPRAGRPQFVQGSFLDEGGYAATAIGRVLGVPSVAVGHGTDVRVARAQAPDGVNRRRRARVALSRADHVIAVSHQLAQELAMIGVRAQVLPFTSDAERFYVTPPSSGHPEVLFVGKVGRGKGVDRLLKAFTRMRRQDASLRLVGPNAGDIDLARQIDALGLRARVIVEGEVSQVLLPERYHRSACLVLPSRGEGLPCVLVESLLSGRPVVASDVGGVAELVDEQVGALVTEEGPDALAEAIDGVLDRTFDGSVLRRRAMPFTWQSTGPQLVDMTRALLR